METITINGNPVIVPDPARLYVYSAGVDDRLLAEDFPEIAKAVSVIRQRLGFKGTIEIAALSKNLAGQYSHSQRTIRIAQHVARRDFTYTIEIAVHEALHALGLHHMDNFRSHGGSRCVHGRDTLTHCVTTILLGQVTFEKMKFLQQNVGAFSKKLLRQIAMVEVILWTQHKIPDALGGCKIADLTDSRMYRWKQMSPEQRRRQVNKMQIGRMKSLGWDVKVSYCHDAPALYNGRSYSWTCEECFKECAVRDA